MNVEQAKSELELALMQVHPEHDDKIIVGHMRRALELLESDEEIGADEEAAQYDSDWAENQVYRYGR